MITLINYFSTQAQAPVQPALRKVKAPFCMGDFAKLQVYSTKRWFSFDRLVKARVEVIKLSTRIAVHGTKQFLLTLKGIALMGPQILAFPFRRNKNVISTNYRQTLVHFNCTRLALQGLSVSVPLLFLPSAALKLYQWNALVQKTEAIENQKGFSKKTKVLVGAAVLALAALGCWVKLKGQGSIQMKPFLPRVDVCALDADVSPVTPWFTQPA